MEHVIKAIKMTRLFDSGYVGGLLYYANLFLVASGATAIDAGINVGDVVTGRAQAELSFYVLHGGCQSFGVVGAGAQNVESKTLGTLAADAWQLLQFVDQADHWFCEFRHFSVV